MYLLVQIDFFFFPPSKRGGWGKEKIAEGIIENAPIFNSCPDIFRLL